jgi:hypothetical protein
MGRGGFRGFAATPVGRACLVALSAGILTLSIAFTGFLVAIPAFIIFGLGLPIYLGWKRPRHLAIAGLVALLVAAPLASAYFTYETRQPTPAVASPAEVGADGHSGSVLQNGYVTPFDGAGGATYTFSVVVDPEFFPPGSNLTEIVFYVSTCVYNVTANSTDDCPGTIDHFTQNRTFTTSPSQPFTQNFTQVLPGANIWYWTEFAGFRNGSSYIWVGLAAPDGYDYVPGPVTGDFTSTYEALAPGIFADTFLLPGVVYAIALLLYAYLKNREAKRKGYRDPAMLPPMADAPGGGPPRPGVGAPPGATPIPAPANERACPNCQAVIYPHEVRCWKCGADVTGSAPAAAPLSSSPPPPSP